MIRETPVERLTPLDQSAPLPDLPDALRHRVSCLPAAWLIGIDGEFSRVRLDAARGVASAARRWKAVFRKLGPGQRVVWVVPNDDDLGFDPAEARAVAETVCAVDGAFEVRDGQRRFTVITATTRRQVVGFLLNYRRVQRGDVGRVTAHAQHLHAVGLPVAAVLVDDRLARSARRRAVDGLRLSRASALWRRAAVGPWLRTAERTLAKRALDSLASNLPGHPLILACEDGLGLAELEGPYRERIEADLSWSFGGDPDTPPPVLERPGAWLKGGAYYAQPFDSRTPGMQAKGTILRVVRSPAHPSVDRTLRPCAGPQHRLDLLLDYFRFESYLRRMTDVGLAQRYHEFKVFGRAGGGPAVKTTLIELNPSVSEATCAALAEAFRTLQQAGDLVVAGWREFREAAELEAAARARGTGEDVLRRQRDAHGYLQEIPADEPLRADVVEFVTVLPDRLGATIEIGAGTGRLARELRRRASRYVCIDLAAESMAQPGDGLTSAAADFERLPFADASFDTVIANNVLEHARDPLAALVELRRVLAPGGCLYALIPLDGLASCYELPAHLWKADLVSITRAVVAAGFTVDRADGINLYALAIPASFPSCLGWVCRLVARKESEPCVAS